MSKRILAYTLVLLLVLTPLLIPSSQIKLSMAQGHSSPDMDALLEEALSKASPQTRECIQCHLQETPGIVYDWLGSEHAWSKPSDVLELYAKIGYDASIADKFNGYNYTIGCYECHGMFKESDRPDIATSHFGYEIVTIVTLKDCSQCHAKEAMEISWTMHGFAALNAPLKPWYAKIVKYAKENSKLDMLPPVYENTGHALVSWDWYKEYAGKLLNNPSDPEVQMFGTVYDEDFRNIVSPLYPASGVLNSTDIMHSDGWKNAYVYHACMECHGSLVVPYKDEGYRIKYWGWPSNGAGRVDPDGSIGTCTACHTRHSFSVEEVRKPHTCGQCHLGYDHPHIEIYEESKHGNIYDSEGESWNWTAIPWKVGADFRAPTCAVCHMSTIADPEGNIVVPGTHDLRARLVWDQMHFFSYPKPKWADHTQNAIIKGGSQLTGKGLLENGVVPEGYKVQLDKAPAPGEFGFPRIVSVKYTGVLKEKRDAMKSVCELCHTSQWVDNYFTTYDQVIVEYNITAHYAFSLLQKAYELGIHDPSNKIDEYMEIMWYYIWHHEGRRWRNGASMMGPDFAHWFGIVDTVMDKLGRMVSYYNTAVELMNTKKQLDALMASGVASQEDVQQLQSKIQQLENKLAAMESQIPQLKSKINENKAAIETLQANLDAVKKDVNELNSNVKNLQTTLDEEVKPGIDEAKTSASKAGTAMVLGGIGLVVALIAIGLVLARKF